MNITYDTATRALSIDASNPPPHGDTLTASETFTAPRPAQPYPSWAWVDGRWQPPVPYPDNDARYNWNEDAQAWGL